MRILVATLAITSLAIADPAFTNLATNRDGSILYFSSPLRLKNSAQPLWPKIFTWTAQEGVELYQQRDAGNLNAAYPWGSNQPYRLLAPSISSDGSTVAFTGAMDCNWGTPCAITFEKYQSTIRVPGKPDTFLDGSATLSPNGRYALLFSSRYLSGGPEVPMWWTDLQTGEKITLTARATGLAQRHQISNDGSVVRPLAQQGIALWRPGAMKTLPSRFSRVLINASGSTLVAQTDTGLIAYDVATGSQTALSHGPQDLPTDISDDASVIAFLNDGRLHTIRSDGTDIRAHATPDKVIDATLSGDGRILFAATDASRIIRLDLATQTVGEIVPPTTYFPLITNAVGFDSSVAAGSLLQLTAVPSLNLPDTKPRSARFHGVTWPILYAERGVISLQVPWEMPMNDSGDFLELLLPATTDTPFQPALIQSTPLRVIKQALQWFTQPGSAQPLNTFLLAAHADFSGIITPDQPARPGEILHAYGSGFGPVTTPPATGEPAAANPLSAVIESSQCELEMNRETFSLPVLFAGLAPGMIGVYQLDLQLPERLTDSSAILRCKSEDSIAGASLPLTQSND